MEGAMDYSNLRIVHHLPIKKRQYKKIYICSPLAAPCWLDMHNNMETARYYAGFVSRIFSCRTLATHAYLPLLLRDDEPEERAIALEMGLRLLATCDALMICGAHISNGMAGEIRKAQELGIPILFLEDYV